MSDEILNIRVTEQELELIMDLLHEAGNRVDANGQPAFELCHDLMGQSGGAVDELESTDFDGRTFSVAESDFIDHGVRAREMQKAEKASSQAASRRDFNLKRQDNRLSKTQTHDVWDANDPKNW